MKNLILLFCIFVNTQIICTDATSENKPGSSTQTSLRDQLIQRYLNVTFTKDAFIRNLDPAFRQFCLDNKIKPDIVSELQAAMKEELDNGAFEIIQKSMELFETFRQIFDKITDPTLIDKLFVNLQNETILKTIQDKYFTSFFKGFFSSVLKSIQENTQRISNNKS